MGRGGVEELAEQNGSLRVFPPAINFLAAEAGVPQTVVLTIKNTGKKSCNVKVKKPETKAWSVQANLTTKLAPGLETIIEVLFLADEVRDYHDKLKVSSEYESVEVPLHAQAPAAQLQVDNNLDMGVVVVDSIITRELTLTNNGSKGCDFTLAYDHGPSFNIFPESGTVPANSVKKLSVTHTPSEVGVFAQPVEVRVNDGKGPRRVNVSATAVNHGFELMQGDGLLTKIDFGSVYYGDAQTVKAEVLNNGPDTVQYLIRLSRRDDAEAAAAMQDDVDDDQDKFDEEDETKRHVGGMLVVARLKSWQMSSKDHHITCSPLRGSIAPYEKKTIEFTFAPKQDKNNKGFKSTADPLSMYSVQNTFLCVVAFQNHTKKLKIPIFGKGVEAGLQLVPPKLRFGDVEMHKHADCMVLLENASEDLPVDFSIARSTYFKATPSKGRVSPGQAFSVLVTFSPRNLGKMTDTLRVKTYSNLGLLVQDMPLPVKGVCTQVAEKVLIKGGPEALPEHFEREKRFVSDQVENLYPPKKPFVRVPTLEREDMLEQYSLQMPTENTLTLEEAKMTQAHKDHYARYIKDNRLAREGKALAQEARKKGYDAAAMATDTISLGLQSASGLNEPFLDIPKEVDPLYMINMDKGGGGYVRPRNRPAYLEEEAQLSTTKFKSKPTTQQELRECAATLTPYEVTRLACGPAVLDFGTVCAMSSTTKYFAVTNDLKQSILVKVNTAQFEELTCEPEQAVVPPGGTAGLGISLCVSTIQAYKQSVSYTINGGAHMFFFDIVADVIPVTLQLSTNELVFRFTPENWEPYIVEDIVISNPNSYPAEYTWEVHNASYTITPSHGVVDRKSSLVASIKWRPTNVPGMNEALLNLRVVGATTVTGIRCIGENPEGKCSFREKTLQLGTISLGVPQQRTVLLRNTGTSDAVFQVELPQSPSYKLKCTPERGRMQVGQMVELEVSFEAMDAQAYDIHFLVHVRGGKTLKMPIHGEAILPTVSLEQDEFNFGQVYIGGSREVDVTLSNDCAITATLDLDLRNYGAFYVDIPRENWSTGEDYEECPITEVKEDGSVVPLRIPSAVPTASANGNTEEREGMWYRIKLAGSKSLTFQIVFRPTVITSHAFDLPLVLAGSGDDFSGLNKVVVAEALRPHLLLSSTMLDFGSKIVLRERVKKIPYALDITLTNNDEVELEWFLGTPKPASSFSASVFQMEPKEGKLPVGGLQTVRITFLPRDSYDYEITIPVMLGGKEKKEYVSIEVKGSGCFPRLTFSVREVELPPVPLGVTSIARFLVCNAGYDNLELQYKLPADTSRIPLSLSFPEGRMIGIAKEKVPVELTFSSHKPMSFTASINFIDEDGNRFSVPVTGTTDNCLLTVQPFMDVNAETAHLQTEDGQPTQLKDLPEGQMWYMPRADAAKDDTENLVRWLNATNMRATIDDIPGDFVNSKGQRLIELIEFVSGKPVPGKSNKLSANKKEQAEQMVAQYERVLAHLKSYGALLNMVKPELMLDLDSYKRILGGMEQKVAAQARPDAQSDMLVHWQALAEEGTWEQVSSTVWYSVLFQVFKIFVLSRVTPRQFRSTPGMNLDNEPDTSLSGSNLYSVSESLLLKWMSINFARATPPFCYKLSNFEQDLRSGLVFYSCMVNHWPTLESYYTQLHKPCKLESHFEENANLVLEMFKDLQLSFAITKKDIMQPRARNMLVFVLYLYQTLPQFIPKTSVKFTGVLGQTQTKSIELTNPSNKPIAYTARLEGSNAFTLRDTTVKLDPRSTCDFPIECTPATSKPITGRLVLSSKREGGAHAQTMVFSLDCLTDAKKPIVSVTMESRLYEMNTLPVEVANPFPGDCEFTVTIEQEMMKEPVVEEMEDNKRSASRPRSRDKGKKAKEMSKSAVMMIDEELPQYPNPFGVDRRMLRMKQGERALINAFFLPFELGKHRLTVVFETEKFGSFVYEVVGDAVLPAPTASIKIPCEMQQGPTSKDILLMHPNQSLDQAKRLFLEKHPLSKVKEQAELIRSQKELPKELVYSVESSNSLISAPATMTITAGNTKTTSKSRASIAEPGTPMAAPDSGGDIVTPLPAGSATREPRTSQQSAGGVRESRMSRQSLGSVNADGAGKKPESRMSKDAPTPMLGMAPNTLLITLNPKGPGSYPGKMVLKSSVDVRVVEVEFVASASSVSATLEFECAARQFISQDIPLVNTGDKSLTIRAAITGDAFSGPREVVVPAMSTEQYPLKFKPTWMGEYLGELSLAISSTGETNSYRLKGISEEPLAEGHVSVECKARQSTVVNLTVPNLFGLDREAQYTVYTDIPNVTGEQFLKVATSSTSPFELTISPSKSGTMHGSVTFTAPNGHYVWYTLEVKAARPPEEGVIEVGSRVREAAMIAIPLFNPTDSAIKFNVYFSGDGVLGKKELVVGPQQSEEYELYYSPLFEGQSSGSVHFVSDAVGEFWYKLLTKATPAEPEQVPEMVCEVGTRTHSMVKIQNPLGEEVMLSTSSSNVRNFTITPTTVVIPPYEVADVRIEYIPSSLNEVETAEIVVQDPGAGLWQFQCSGHGLTPTVMEPTVITASIGQSASSMVTFTNPFPSPILVTLSLSTDEKPGVFGIMVKRMRGISLAPFANLQIPIAFAPERMALHRGNLLVEVEGADDIVWTYPLEGMSESRDPSTLHKYKTKARTRLVDTLEVSLTGLGPLGKNESFTHEIVMQNAQDKAALVRALQIKANQAEITSQDEPLTFSVVFEPLRVLNTAVDFVITKASGGRWRFEILLEATEPDIDGTVVLKSAVHQMDTKVINIANPEPSDFEVPFTASLTAETGMEFRVSPTSGVLDGANPVPLTITFSPKEYGKIVLGRLMVHTEDMQWIYDLKGTRPDYTPPVGAPKIEATHTEEVAAQLELASPTKSAAKNFVRGNLTRKLGTSAKK